MAGKYLVIKTIIKSISIYFITCCKKWAFFFCGLFGGKKPTLM